MHYRTAFMIGDELRRQAKEQKMGKKTAMLIEAGNQFASYAESHFAKNTEESLAKGVVNNEMAIRCYQAAGCTDYRLAEPGVKAENRPVQRDSMVSGAPVPLEASGPDAVLAMRAMYQDSMEWVKIPDDRTGFFFEAMDQQLTEIERFFASGGTPDLSIWITRKANQARQMGHSDIANTLEALVAEMAGGLEERPIDFGTTLMAFYDDVHARNVKAGWWSDLAGGAAKKRSVGELFILIVTELWEAYQAYVTNDNDDKLPQYPGIGVELGDVQIRLADFCGALRAGRIVDHSGVRNPGDDLFVRIGELASRYEKIRKTPEAVGDPETGDPLPSMNVAEMILAKLDFNATREDHKPENRMKEGGKQT